MLMDSNEFGSERYIINDYEVIREKPDIGMKLIVFEGMMHFGYASTEEVLDEEEELYEEYLDEEYA